MRYHASRKSGTKPGKLESVEFYATSEREARDELARSHPGDSWEVAVMPIDPNVKPTESDGCEDCMKTGEGWLHLRLCLACGHVGCCDNSPNRHARLHWHTTQHPVIKSFEPGEKWAFNYVTDKTVEYPERLDKLHRSGKEKRGVDGFYHVA